MFFSLSLGMGAMITYGSYLQKKQESVQKNALIVVISDTTRRHHGRQWSLFPPAYAFLGSQ